MYPFDPHTPPSPSPPSSPVLAPDSSPPGSPDLPHAVSLNDDDDVPAPGWTHPIGGTYNQTRRPPLYELRGNGNPTPPRPVRDEPVGFAYGATTSPMRDRNVLPKRDEAFVRKMFEEGQARGEVTDETSAQTKARRSFGRTLTQGPMTDIEAWNEAVAKAIERTGDTNNQRTVIDLSGDSLHKLKEICPCVADLKNLVVLPSLSSSLSSSDGDVFGTPGTRTWNRNRTTPLNSLALNFNTRVNAFSRTGSQPSVSFASEPKLPAPPSHEIHMYLSSNEIPRLPEQLFEVKNLTILSLRNNLIKVVPQGISSLVNLRDLNLAVNCIEYLPSEMLRMTRLEKLLVTSNPLKPPPRQPADKDKTQPTPSSSALVAAVDPATVLATNHTRPVSEPLYCTDGPPSLVELCLRRLISPYEGNTVRAMRFEDTYDERKKVHTNIAELCDLIQPGETRLSPLLIKAIRACAPRAVATSTSYKPPAPEAKINTGMNARKGTPVFYGVCPSPLHSTRHPFYEHAEERYTWESSIGQAKFGTERVPVLWRGCQRGCLDFLLEQQEAAPVMAMAAQDVAMREAVRPAPVRSGGLRFDEDF